MNNLTEKSVSKSQQRFFGMVRAMQKGELSGKIKDRSKIKKVAKSLSPQEVKKFAKTKHKKLPEKVIKKESMYLTVKNLLKD